MDPLGKMMGSAARLKVLRLFLFNKGQAFTLAEVVTRAKISFQAARSELALLLATGLLKKKGSGVAARYALNRSWKHVDALEAFVAATTGLSSARIASALKKAGALRLLVLSGFFTGVAEAQVDILLAGDRLEERKLASIMRALEAEFGREIRYAAFATEDFRYRMGVYDRLIRDVLDYPHRVIVDKFGL